ncbi:MMPL family transporter [Nocardia sp. CDC186]|uniref:MMPL family transporter n=1 Tax=Nocardia implantans TaxID=3108168 RepID=A0ABU6AWJ3_9NOCA|nr:MULTISPECIES: MMPL family transporter [unclassified Nocardia]MBF6192841.1 MMPL family transporter [Nocardia beijingensis]MEA3531441.1 MMPL family transporter [Nocardia sp. CDC192]MEB3511789.1 MMPL family transporter [Nocardia sp. CDC186]
MFARLGAVVVHNPWKVIGLWVLLAIAVVAAAPELKSTTDQSAFLPSHYESIQALELQQKAFPDSSAPAAIIVFARKDAAPLTDADAASVVSIGNGLREAQIKDVIGIQPTPPSQNRLVQIIAVQMTKVTNPNDTTQGDAVKALRKELKDRVAGTELKAGITGQAAQVLDQRESGDKGLAIVGIATVVLILVLLLIIFRSPVIALLPIVVIGAISSMVSGLIAVVAKAFDLQIDASINAILVVVLFGVGTDYILFLMFRYRERLRAGEDSKTAMVSAVTRVGEAITSAAGAVIIAFMALVLSTLGMFRAMGPALAIAVAVALAAGLTLVPAVVSLLGTKVFWPSKAWRTEPKGARFTAIGNALGRRPGLFAAVSGGVLVVLGIFALGFHPTFDLSSGSTSEASESVVYSKELGKGLPAGTTQPTDVLLQSGAGELAADQLTAYRAALAAVPGVGQVAEPKLSTDKSIADFAVTLDAAPESDAALDTVSGPLRDVAHSAAPAGATAAVGGLTSVFVDFQEAMARDYSIVFPVAAILIMIVLGLLLRSLVAPWYLMASVFLGFAATLGAAVLVFQHFRGETGLIFTLPVIMYLFVVALGTDYNILMVARLREEAREGNEPKQAAALAVRHTGPTIAAAGVILAGTFASMMLAGNNVLAQMGFAISVGIAIAAFVMAMFFTPALTALIGHKAWWPGHGDEKPGGAGRESREVVGSSVGEG